MLISPDNFISMPWKNGLGQTLELQKEMGAGQDDFAWRISIAAVTTDGAFSSFAGYDRILLLLKGNGITLEVAGSGQYVLNRPLQTARFRGDDKTIASLHNGPISDFNVMVSRDHCSAEVTSHADTSPVELPVSGDVLLIYSVQGNLSAQMTNSDTKDFDLVVPENHMLRLESPLKKPMRLSGAHFVAVQIFYKDRSERSLCI